MRLVRTALLAAAAILPASSVLAQMQVSIGTARDPNLAAQIVIAESQGFFDDAGLEATVEYFPSGGDLLAAFVGGSVQFGSSGSTPTMILRNRPFPVTVIAQIADISGAQQLISGQDAEALEDLSGKRAGIMQGTASEALFLSLVDDAGMSPEDFELVNLGPTEMIQAFVSGDVDAIAVWEPHTTRARAVGNGKKLASGTTSFYGGMSQANRVYGDHAVFFTSEAYLEESPETVRMVLKALNDATDFISNDRDTAVGILAEAFSLEPQQMSEIMDANEYTVVLDQTLVDDMNSLAEFLESRDRLSDPENAENWISGEVLREIAPDKVALP